METFEIKAQSQEGLQNNCGYQLSICSAYLGCLSPCNTSHTQWIVFLHLNVINNSYMVAPIKCLQSLEPVILMNIGRRRIYFVIFFLIHSDLNSVFHHSVRAIVVPCKVRPRMKILNFRFGSLMISVKILLNTHLLFGNSLISALTYKIGQS